MRPNLQDESASMVATPDAMAEPAAEQPLARSGDRSGKAVLTGTGGGAETHLQPEAPMHRFRRNAVQGRLHAYALGVVALVAVLIALAATNTGRVRVNWLVGTSHVALVWLVLVAAIIGWLLGVLTSLRFQWLTRAPRLARRRG